MICIGLNILMISYLDLYQQQLNNLPTSGYKTQLLKYGHSVLDSIIRKNILYLISDMSGSISNEVSESYSDIKSEHLNIYLNTDLGVTEELVYKTKLDISKINSNIESFISNINGIFISYLSLYDFESSKMDILDVLKLSNKVIVVGNTTIPNLPVSNTNINPKFIKSTCDGSLIFHSNLIKHNEIYLIDVVDRPLDWNIIKPLTVSNNKYIHESYIKIKNKKSITKILIN